MKRRFFTLDVFTDKALCGNPLAVVIDAEGLDDTQMQAIAAEFNLSETVFVFEPKDPVHTAAIRIFTPIRELPFAGHPTVGTAVLLGHLRAPELIGHQEILIVLEERIGPIECTVTQRHDKAAQATFQLVKEPFPGGTPATTDCITMALGLSMDDIGSSHHHPVVFDAGVAFTCIPLNNRGALARAKPRSQNWHQAFGAIGPIGGCYLYYRDETETNIFHTRMFFQTSALIEDPATGAAAAAFSGVIHHFDKLTNGEHKYVLKQGEDMGRPSEIWLKLDIEEDKLVDVAIGGQAVIISQGTLDL